MFLPLADITMELVSIAMVAVGLLVLIIVRVFAGKRADSITRRSYGKIYSDSPGARTDR
ncbi:MAG: hypothetical protein QOJ07_3551 [Thermoleophilaceae bacterium]|jgi:hypothetical protein|nr:hypothetical protein [Thermoleophilaceae bacterium]